MTRLTVWTALLAAFLSLSVAPAFAAGPSAKKEKRSREHKVERDGVRLALYERWAPAEEKNWKQNGRVVLLIHGGTWSSRCTFDPVPQASLMDALADEGYDVWAVDLHNFGGSAKSDRDWTEASAATGDIDAAIDYIRAFRWVEKVHVFGFQWGAQVAGLFATQKPNKVGRLALFGMRYQQHDVGKQPPQYPSRKNGLAQASLKPDDGDLEPDLARRRADVCARLDPDSPNGAVLDSQKVSPVEPADLRVPTLLVQGDRDGGSEALRDRLDFFGRLTSPQRAFVVLEGVGKWALLERNRFRLTRALVDFFDAP